MGNTNKNNSIYWVGLEPVKSDLPPPYQKFLRNFQMTLEYIKTVITTLKVTKISITSHLVSCRKKIKTLIAPCIIVKVEEGQELTISKRTGKRE